MHISGIYKLLSCGALIERALDKTMGRCGQVGELSAILEYDISQGIVDKSWELEI